MLPCILAGVIVVVTLCMAAAFTPSTEVCTTRRVYTHIATAITLWIVLYAAFTYLSKTLNHVNQESGPKALSSY
jgi:hypothetical protein